MTLYAFALQHDRVDVISDSLAYNHDRSRFVYHGSKGEFFEGFGVLATSTGAAGVGVQARGWLTALHADRSVFDVDALAREVPPVFAAMYEETVQWRSRHLNVCNPGLVTEINLFGWSDERQRMVGYNFASGHPSPDLDWLGREVLDMVNDRQRALGRPERELSWTVRPHVFEPNGRLVGGYTSPPETDEEWANIAITAREYQHGKPLEDRTFFGGDVHRMTLTRDGYTERVIHTFDDSGPKWEALIGRSCQPERWAAERWAASISA